MAPSKPNNDAQLPIPFDVQKQPVSEAAEPFTAWTCRVYSALLPGLDVCTVPCPLCGYDTSCWDKYLARISSIKPLIVSLQRHEVGTPGIKIMDTFQTLACWPVASWKAILIYAPRCWRALDYLRLLMVPRCPTTQWRRETAWHGMHVGLFHGNLSARPWEPPASAGQTQAHVDVCVCLSQLRVRPRFQTPVPPVGR